MKSKQSIKKIITLSILVITMVFSTLLFSSFNSNESESNKEDLNATKGYWNLGARVNLPGQGTVFVCQGWGIVLCYVDGPITGPHK